MVPDHQEACDAATGDAEQVVWSWGGQQMAAASMAAVFQPSGDCSAAVSFLHATECVMLPVLDFDPMLRPAAGRGRDLRSYSSAFASGSAL